MSPPSGPDDTKAMRDPIGWKQIFIGYGMVLMMLMMSLFFQLGLSQDQGAMKGIGTVGIFAVVIAGWALARPLGAFRRDVLAVRPALEDGLQWAAIVALVLLSAVTIAHGIMVLPASGWS